MKHKLLFLFVSLFTFTTCCIAGSTSAALAQRVATAYIPYMESTLTFLEKRTQDVVGRPIAHILLLFFIFTTYIPAPVFGFGWILAIMGLALAKDNFPKIAAAYLVSFFAILFYQLPWRDWVLKS